MRERNRSLSIAIRMASATTLVASTPALAARPTDGGGLHPYDETDVLDAVDSPEALVRVHFSRSGPNAALATDDDLDGIPDIAADVAITAEAVLDTFRALGFRLPVHEVEVGLEALGGSDALDVYLVDFAGVADGQFSTDRCRDGMCAGHLLIENDFAGYGYSSTTEAIEVLTSHELFHGVQFAYADVMAVWMSEGSAVWAEHAFRPAIDDFLGFCSAYQRDLARPFDSPPAGTVTAASYGVGLLFAFLVEQSEPGLMVSLMESAAVDAAAGLEPGLDALLRAASAHALDLAAEWPRFAAFNAASGRRAGDEPTFSFGAALAGVTVADAVDLSAAPVGRFDERLYPLAALFYRVDHAGGPLLLRVSEASPATWIEVWPAASATGPLSTPLLGLALHSETGTTEADLGAQPAGSYLIGLSHTGIGESSSRPVVCVGAPGAVEDACPMTDAADSGQPDAPLDEDSGAPTGPEAASTDEPHTNGKSSGCMSAPPIGLWGLCAAIAAAARRRTLLVGMAATSACAPISDPLRKGPSGGDSGSAAGGSSGAEDAGTEGTADGAGDGGTDASTDGTADGGTDASTDGTADGGADGGADAGTDGGTTGPVLPDEVRGIWITRYVWSDEDDLRRVLGEVADAGFNTVFFQCRGTYDAYYASAFEPWAQRLTGTLGRDPGWDPLAVAVDVAHSRGMQLHAYINAVPFWQGTTPPAESSPRHALLDHPEWLVAGSDGTPMALNSSYVYASLGNPEVRQRIADVAADIADHYAVDGVHLDYIRYPGSDMSHDAVSTAAYAADSGGLGYGDWQRERVVEAVSQVDAAVSVPVTAAVWGIYENDWGWSAVSQGNVDFYQDSRRFTSTGAADAIMPMIYWPNTATSGDRLDFRTLVADHVANNPDGTVVAGVGNTITFEQLVDCIRTARDEGARGVVVFDYSLFADRLGELAGVFAEAD